MQLPYAYSLDLIGDLCTCLCRLRLSVCIIAGVGDGCCGSRDRSLHTSSIAASEHYGKGAILPCCSLLSSLWSLYAHKAFYTKESYSTICIFDEDVSTS